MSRAGDTGRRAENAVVEALRRHGFPAAERRRMKGNLDEGDLSGVPDTVVQVKGGNGGASNRSRLAEWVDATEAQVANAGATRGVLVVKRVGKGRADDWFAVMPLWRWSALARSGRPVEWAPNSPLLDRLCHVARSPGDQLTITAEEANVLLAWLSDDQSENQQ